MDDIEAVLTLHDETLVLTMHKHLQYKEKTQHPSHPLHKHTIYFNTPGLNTIFYSGRYNRHKNKHAPYTYIYCLATRGNNKILHTPPPHISSSDEILPRLTCRTCAQLTTNNSPFLKSYLHKVDVKSHPSPLCPLCHTHIHNPHHLLNCTHIRTTLSPLDLWIDPAGQM